MIKTVWFSSWYSEDPETIPHTLTWRRQNDPTPPPHPSPEKRMMLDLESVLKEFSDTVLRYNAAREKRVAAEIEVLQVVKEMVESGGKGRG